MQYFKKRRQLAVQMAFRSGIGLAQGFVAILCISLLFRLVFLFMLRHQPGLWNSAPDLIHAFWLGLRFDLSIASYVTVIPFLSLLVVFYLGNFRFWVAYQKFLRGWYGVWISIIVLISVIDLGFFSFYKDRLNILVFGFFEDDTWALVKTIWKDYPVVTALFTGAGSLYVLFRWLERVFDKKLPEKATRPFWGGVELGAVLLLLTLALGGRGHFNFKMYPIGVMDTDISPNYYINKLSYNALYALNDAVQVRVKTRSQDFDLVREMGYSGKLGQAGKDFASPGLEPINQSEGASSNSKSTLKPRGMAEGLFLRKTEPKGASFQKPHVLVLLLESWGSFWLKAQTENFDLLGRFRAHLRRDYFLPTILPSSNGTYVSVVSVALNLPDFPGTPPPESLLAGTSFPTAAAKPFSNAGYRTTYVYGGGIGWRNLGGFLRKQYFDEVGGAGMIEEALGESLKTHDWGVFDGQFYDYLKKKLRTSEKPQFVFGLTTTNHPPYELPADAELVDLKIPKELKDRIVTDEAAALKRFRAYRYACDQLGLFLDWLKSSPLGERTIVAVTGDHNFFDLVNFTPEQFKDWRGVPFYLYVPPQYRHQSFPVTAQALAKDGSAKESSISFSSQQDQLVASHLDILPTLYELALPHEEYFAFGQSLVHPERYPRLALNSDVAWQRGEAIVGNRPYLANDVGEFQLVNAASRLETRRRAAWALVGSLLDELKQKRRLR